MKNATISRRTPTNSVRMKGANGFHMDIANVPATSRDLTLICMNADNPDAASEFLTAKGFVNSRDDQMVDAKSNKSCVRTLNLRVSKACRQWEPAAYSYGRSRIAEKNMECRPLSLSSQIKPCGK